MRLEYGDVKFFDNRGTKLYGFLNVLDENGQQTGEDVFFHYNDGQWITVAESNIGFIGRISLASGSFLPLPQIGVKLAFLRQPTAKGDKACPWTYAAEYDACLRELATSSPEPVNSTANPDSPPTPERADQH